METIIFYILFFCIGTVFGSFFTLAVHRIPLHQNITHERSYCPNCNHKLSFWDMIPILSYILLGGKCRYCKKKIRIRYLLLEVLTGIVFLLFAISLNFKFYTFEVSKFIYLIFSLLYIAGIIIIAGIDKEKHQINKNVMIYEMIIVSAYMIYLYIVEKTNIYRYVIYLIFIAILLILENTYFKNKLKNNYTIEILELILLMTMFSYELEFVYIAILTLLTIAIERIIYLIKDKKSKVHKTEKSHYKNLPIGFYLCCSNIIVLIIINWLAFRR